MIAGNDYQDAIDNNIEDADIICLFISANFLSSDACMEEKDNALKLMQQKGTAVVPVILAPCGWSDETDLRRLLAIPTDGKPVTSFGEIDAAWNDVYKSLKELINSEIKIKQLSITETFYEFLNNTDLLSRAHSQKDIVLLKDIFVYPELSKFDYLREYEKKINSDKLIEKFYHFSKVLIAGESQSGKTTLCKKIFVRLREKNFVPIYIFDRTYQYKGNIQNRIEKAFNEQYENTAIEEINRNRIVPIVDDFYLANNRGKHIQNLAEYKHQIIVVDDIFSLNLKDENLIKQFIHFKIEELNPLLR
ncbi:MAG: TIR domain-containing protein, partial [Desulfobacula sp.]|nr:TIR domain-containing protein [Desulfobacula sp.]